jgi:RNA polymerase sigma factor (sigma-70 family)
MIIPMTDDERRLTEEYLYLVPEMVKKLTTRCAYVSYDEQQDLLQAGNLALCKAAMNYDNTRPFAVYARVAIRNAIYSYWRKLQKERKYTCSMYANLTWNPCL